MTTRSMNLHYPLFRSTTSDTGEFSLSQLSAQMPESDSVIPSNAPMPALSPVQNDHLMCNDFALFLDFRKKLPHSIAQYNTCGD